MLVGFALAWLAVDRMALSFRIFFIGFAATWVVSEFYLARRLTGADAKSVTIAVFTGFAFPWVGFLLAFALNALRP
jgi:hypothetical protein